MIDASSFSFFAVVIAIALVFELSNGFNDAANAIATVVSTRVMSPLQAVLMAAVMNVVGALTGTAVAKTVGKGVVDPGALSGEFGMVTVGAGVLAAAIWVFAATRFGMPVSGSHSLVSGVAGAGIAHAGLGVLVRAGIRKIALGLVFSPILGFLFGYAIMLAIYWGFRRASPVMVYSIFGKLQLGTAAAMAFSHGSNDAQKTMGIITLALSVYYEWERKGIPFEVPLWVILVSGLVMGIGTYLGGWRVIRTLGVRIVTMRSPHGFAAGGVGGVGDRVRVTDRNPGEHDPRHHVVHPGHGLDPPPVGRPLGRGAGDHVRLGADVPGGGPSGRRPLLRAAPADGLAGCWIPTGRDDHPPDPLSFGRLRTGSQTPGPLRQAQDRLRQSSGPGRRRRSLGPPTHGDPQSLH